MNEGEIREASFIVQSMKDAAKKLEAAVNKNNSDSIMEIKKQLADMQKQLAALI